MHYYKLFKEEDDVAFEPLVRRMLLEGYWYTVYQRGTADSPAEDMPEKPKATEGKLIFVSYAREDWDNFVNNLVVWLKQQDFSVWVDHHLLIGGEDWMDAIGEALDKAHLLLLVISPDSIESRYVKMEYRYFFNHGKPIVPLLYRPVGRIPPELLSTQYIDFTLLEREIGLQQVQQVTKRYFKQDKT